MREALTDQDPYDEQPTWSTPAITITQPRPESATSVMPPPVAPTLASEPLGSCTLRDGTKITLRELDGEDESVGEVLADQLGVTLAGASKGTYTRVMAQCSIHTIDGKEQAPVRHMEQLQRLMKYKSKDQLTIMLCYQRFVTEDATGEGTFPGAR